MPLNNDYIKALLLSVGFVPNSSYSIFFKTYPRHDNYKITVNLQKQKIDYGKKIDPGDGTTSNFDKDENLVVLECVNHLLEKGYNPGDLYLEKKWKLGRSKKGGKADITVRGRNGNTLLIIECKTWGEEYEKEKERMRQDGGQLFSYFRQDQDTRFLCLYASRLNDGIIEYYNSIIKTLDTEDELVRQEKDPDKLITYSNAKKVGDLLEVWQAKSKKEFLPKGIFEADIEPYNPGFIPLKLKDLQDFQRDDIRKVYNEFEEILRHNNISDRSNAFNRVISLILAKIVDEAKPHDVRADFQILEGIDTAEDLIDRLMNLYTKSMKDYLKEDVVNYSQSDIEDIVKNFPRQTTQERLKQIFRELKYYSNNEFAFKEIYNERLFHENAKVLEEVVRLFQRYRFKYNKKSQFLGDFFELILESGYKQTEGQFFTPQPIAKFIAYSVPLRNIIERKLNEESKDPLPYLIDFACGSGHFLTESIEEMLNILNTLDDSRYPQIKLFKENMDWAGQYIYGIEKDYRLARTSQVACFMHGDGEAEIIFGDGLQRHEDRFKDGIFDVLMANPPYTIKDFKKHLNFKKLPDYELFNSISPDSDDIEVMFIERAKQLVRTDGVVGIILPVSILSNSGIYTRAREIILKHFEIKAIIELTEAFAATGTTTVVMFMKKRDDYFHKDRLYIAEDFILQNKERQNDFIDSKSLLKDYAEYRGLSIEDYRTFVQRKPNERIQTADLYKDYKRWFENGCSELRNLQKKAAFKSLPEDEQAQKIEELFYDLALEKEKEKFYYFMLASGQKTIIVKAAKDKTTQREILGYSFSDRRGYKGIDIKTDAGGKPLTKLYDEHDRLNPEKISSYILRSFIDEPQPHISESLNGRLDIVNLIDLIDFEKVELEKTININAHKRIETKSNWETVKLGEVASLEYGSSLPEKNRIHGEYPVVGSNGIVGYHFEYLVSAPAVIVGRKGSAGKVTYIKKNCFPIDTTYYLKVNPDKLNMRFAFFILDSLKLELIAEGSGVPGLNRNRVHDLIIPLPPLHIQKQIVSEMEAVEQDIEADKKEMERLRAKIDRVVDGVFEKEKNYERLGNVTEIKSGGTPKTSVRSYWEGGTINWATLTDVKQKYLYKTQKSITQEGLENSNAVLLPVNTVLFSSRATIGAVSIARVETCTNQGFKNFICDENRLNYVFLYYVLKHETENIKKLASGMTYLEVSKTDMANFQIPLPSPETQKEIISKIEVFEGRIKRIEDNMTALKQKKEETLKKHIG